MREQRNNSLEALPALIERAHRAARECVSAALRHAHEAGRLLLAARRLVPRGEWLAWIGANCRFSQRTAQGYMRVHRRWRELENAQRVADLPLRAGLKLLSSPRKKKWSLPPPDPRFPEPGPNGLFGISIGEEDVLAVVWPAVQEGYFYVARWDNQPDGSAIAEGGVRPLSAWGVAHYLEYLRLPPMEWKAFRDEIEPLDWNCFIGTPPESLHPQSHDGWPLLHRKGGVKSPAENGSKTPRSLSHTHGAIKSGG